MLGPFPGVDPYVEKFDVWRGARVLFIARIAASLNAGLPEEFTAEINERVYFVYDDRSTYPEWWIRDTAARRKSESAHVGGADIPVIVNMREHEVHDRFIEIVPVSDPGRTVTVIELPGHANKTANRPERDNYIEGQCRHLAGDINLIEIDLLRSGIETVAAPRASMSPALPRDYTISLRRSAAPFRFEVWPVSVRTRLPKVSVPLLDGVCDFALDLQEAYDAAYRDGAFHKCVDYRIEPEPPLDDDEAAWADALLRERGLRP